MFKGLVFALVSIAAFNSFACEQQEGQFIGTVTNFREIQRSETTKECFYKIDYKMFNSSIVCPLDIDEVSYLEFQDESCSLKNGDQVSGVMVRLNDKIVIE